MPNLAIQLGTLANGGPQGLSGVVPPESPGFSAFRDVLLDRSLDGQSGMAGQSVIPSMSNGTAGESQPEPRAGKVSVQDFNSLAVLGRGLHSKIVQVWFQSRVLLAVCSCLMPDA